MTETELPPRLMRILEVLTIGEREDRPLGTKEIVEKSGHAYNTVSSGLSKLTELGYVRRTYGPSRTHRYRLTKRRLPPVGEKTDFAALTAEQALKALKMFAEPNWQPMYANPNSWKQVNQSSFDLLNAVHLLRQGETVDQSSLDASREGLKSVQAALSRALTTVGKLLATNDLWDATKLGSFTADDSDNTQSNER